MSNSHPSTDERAVVGARVVVHTSGGYPNSPMSDNHWTIFLLLSGGKESVRMNMTAEYDDPTGNLLWKPVKYILSRSCVRFWDFHMVSGVRVRDVYALVMNYGRNNYEMSGGGSGCRWWCYVIMKDLGNAKFLADSNAGDRLYPELLYQYSLKADRKPLKMVQGEFTSGPTASSAASTSSSAQPSSGKPTSVQVQPYTAGKYLCYMWMINGKQDHSSASDWTSVTYGGKPCIHHRAKNLIARRP